MYKCNMYTCMHVNAIAAIATSQQFVGGHISSMRKPPKTNALLFMVERHVVGPYGWRPRDMNGRKVCIFCQVLVFVYGLGQLGLKVKCIYIYIGIECWTYTSPTQTHVRNLHVCIYAHLYIYVLNVERMFQQPKHIQTHKTVASSI